MALAVTFTEHIQKSAEDNPIRAVRAWLASNENKNRRPRGSVLAACGDDSILGKLPVVRQVIQQTASQSDAADAAQQEENQQEPEGIIVTRLDRRLQAFHTRQYAKGFKS